MAQPSPIDDEVDAVRERYRRRQGDARRYSLLDRTALLAMQERERVLAALIVGLGWHDLSSRKLVEVGCGTGANLLELLRFGFSPEHLQGIELMQESAERARRVLPPSVRIQIGDASAPGTGIPHGTQDVAFQATVFSSILDDRLQVRLAETMWQWVRPGGGILWYDFTVDNPRNPDVRGVPLARVRELFPEGTIQSRRVTLAPPVARLVTKLHPSLYSILNACPWLRTHAHVWISKRS